MNSGSTSFRSRARWSSRKSATGSLEGPNKVVEPRFDLTVRRSKLTPKHRVEAVPPEEFRISREAKTVSTAALTGHERMIPLSQLIQMGYPPAVILGDDYGTSAAISTVEQDMRNPGGLGQLMMGARDAVAGRSAHPLRRVVHPHRQGRRRRP